MSAAHLDEMMIGRINTGAVDGEVIVELAAAALVTTLQTVLALDRPSSWHRRSSRRSTRSRLASTSGSPDVDLEIDPG